MASFSALRSGRTSPSPSTPLKRRHTQTICSTIMKSSIPQSYSILVAYRTLVSGFDRYLLLPLLTGYWALQTLGLCRARINRFPRRPSQQRFCIQPAPIRSIRLFVSFPLSEFCPLHPFNLMTFFPGMTSRPIPPPQQSIRLLRPTPIPTRDHTTVASRQAL